MLYYVVLYCVISYHSMLYHSIVSILWATYLPTYPPTVYTQHATARYRASCRFALTDCTLAQLFVLMCYMFVILYGLFMVLGVFVLCCCAYCV